MPAVDTAHLRALVVAYRKPEDQQPALAIAADPVWGGPDVVDVGGVRARVVGCRSPLAVREMLAGHTGGPGELLVVLTPCSGSELGPDVRAQLVRYDVLPLDAFASVLGLFGARVLDPQLVAERWLVEDLIATSPPGGWADRKPLAGVLDVDLAWSVWQQARLGLSDQPATVADVLAIGQRPDVGTALGDLPAEQRARLATRWAGGAISSPVPAMVELLATGRGGDLSALGLVAGVLWAPADDAETAARQREARARLEPVLGRDRLDRRSAAEWAEAAAAIVDAVPGALDRAQSILSEAGASSLAVLSAFLPGGFDQRRAELGRALSAGNVASAEAALVLVREHRQASSHGHRVETAEAAVRLLRRQTSGPRRAEVPSRFAAEALAYARDGAWVEDARRLLNEGDQVPEAAAAYRALADAAESEQLAASRRFAAVLAEWSAAEPLPDPRIVPIERVLDEVVAPVARAAPVLLVVCDGLSLAVSHALVRSLRASGWGRAVPAGQDGWPVAVAMMPTVTDVSRTSLLSGSRQHGGQAEERAGFGGHGALRAASSANRPPVLFHKAGLVAPNGIALPDPVRQLVADPDQRVVGVVVNSVDDHLARGDQVRVGWDLDSLRPLRWLLDAAAEAGRMIVLTADHGHVLHGPGSASRPQAGGGERWRTSPPPAGDGEVEVAGPRVLADGGRVVLPSDDRLRYGGFKHGYHGGATPEEVLVPLEVLARVLPAGWEHRPLAEPSWWTGVGAAVAVGPPPPRPVAAAVSVRPSLFDPPVEATVVRTATWVEALLAAPAFAAQRARLPRPVPDDRLRRYLDAIEANGGSIPVAVLASRTGEPPDTLRIALAPVQRLLNLDGAEVLVVRADGTVELNRELADLQFEIGGR